MLAIWQYYGRRCRHYVVNAAAASHLKIIIEAMREKKLMSKISSSFALPGGDTATLRHRRESMTWRYAGVAAKVFGWLQNGEALSGALAALA